MPSYLKVNKKKLLQKSRKLINDWNFEIILRLNCTLQLKKKKNDVLDYYSFLYS